MVLHAYGYDFQPPYLEALMAMGNGANFLNDDPRHPLFSLTMVNRIFRLATVYKCWDLNMTNIT